MHIDFITRGIKHDVDRFINELSCQYLPYMHKMNAKGELVDKPLEKGALQVRVCPLQLWDVSFPKEYPFRPAVEEYLCLDTSKSKKILGWKPQVSLEEGFRKTIEYWKSRV